MPDPAAENFEAPCAALYHLAAFCDAHDAIETAQAFGAGHIEMRAGGTEPARDAVALDGLTRHFALCAHRDRSPKPPPTPAEKFA